LGPFDNTVSGSASMAGGGASSQASLQSFLTFDGAGNLLSFEGDGSAHAAASQPRRPNPEGSSVGGGYSHSELC